MEIKPHSAQRENITLLYTFLQPSPHSLKPFVLII